MTEPTAPDPDTLAAILAEHLQAHAYDGPADDGEMEDCQCGGSFFVQAEHVPGAIADRLLADGRLDIRYTTTQHGDQHG